MHSHRRESPEILFVYFAPEDGDVGKLKSEAPNQV